MSGVVKIPTDSDEAASMVLIGMAWLEAKDKSKLTEVHQELSREVAARAGKAGFMAGLDARRSIEYDVHNGDWSAAERAAEEYANKIKSGEVKI